MLLALTASGTDTPDRDWVCELSANGTIMPRYFFNVHIEDDIVSDPDGQNLRDADQAWEVARAMAENLMATEFEQPINWASCIIEVKDELDEIVLEFPILEAVQFTQLRH